METRGSKLVDVHVPSYLLPDDVSLEDAYYDHVQLDSKPAVVQCSWEWLKKQVTPLLRQILDEQLFGITVVEGSGRDHPDPSVAQRDVSVMSAFAGKTHRTYGFMAPPISHKFAELPDVEFAEANQRKGQKLLDHPSKTRTFIKHVISLNIKGTPPPLPRIRYQISRLKWIPTEEVGASDATKLTVGYFQGAYCIPGTTHYSIVSLNEDWVRWEFEPPFIQSVKEQAVSGTKAERKLIPVPPGDPHVHDLPNQHLVLEGRPTKYQQRNETTCLIDAFCSAMYEFGCVHPVEKLRADPKSAVVSAGNQNIWRDFIQLVNTHFSSVGIRLCKLRGAKDVDAILTWKDNFVIVVSLKASDASDGQHAIAICDGGIFDANSGNVLSKTQESLDWCCGGGGVTCIGMHRSYVALPLDYSNRPVEHHILFQVLKPQGLVRGWLCGDFLKPRPKIQLADGEKRRAEENEFASFISLT